MTENFAQQPDDFEFPVVTKQPVVVVKITEDDLPIEFPGAICQVDRTQQILTVYREGECVGYFDVHLLSYFYTDER